MSQLMIQSPGVFGLDLVNVIGASTSRGREDTIGMFGSGDNHAVAACLRQGVGLRRYIGKDGFTYVVAERETRDVTGTVVPIKEVLLKQIAGSRRCTKPLGFDMSFGEQDWRCPSLAVREFISNAADACMRQFGDYKKVVIEEVDENQVRAKDGYTRIFMDMTPPIRDYFNNYRDKFLIFDRDYRPDETVLPKREPGSHVSVYRRGVLVGTFPYVSLFDYNLPDIEVKESRIISEWDAKYACANALRRSTSERLEEYLEALVSGTPCFEVNQLDRDYLQADRYDSKKSQEEVQKCWKAALTTVLGDRGVVVDNAFAADFVKQKGYKPIVLESRMAKLLKEYGARSSHDVLNVFEQNGRTEVVLTESQLTLARRIWNTLEELGVTNGREMPAIEGYRNLDTVAIATGYYDPSRDTVGLSSDILDEAPGFTFIKCLIEEYAHAITNALDCTRTFQDYAFRVAALLMSQELTR